MIREYSHLNLKYPNMYKLIVVIAIAGGLLACQGNKKGGKSMDYDQKIMSTISQMQQSLFAVQKGLGDTAVGKDQVFTKYESVLDSLTGNIKSMPAFDGDSAYRDAAAHLGEFYKNSIGNYYVNIAKIYKEVKDTSAETKVNVLLAKLQEEEKVADDSFLKERAAFAGKHGITIEAENAGEPGADTTKH